MTPVAQAYYQTTYEGRVAVYLTPFRTTRKRRFAIRYRWLTGRGSPVGGTYVNPGAAIMLAMCHPLYDTPACMVEQRHHFTTED